MKWYILGTFVDSYKKGWDIAYPFFESVELPSVWIRVMIYAMFIQMSVQIK